MSGICLRIHSIVEKLLIYLLRNGDIGGKCQSFTPLSELGGKFQSFPSLSEFGGKCLTIASTELGGKCQTIASTRRQLSDICLRIHSRVGNLTKCAFLDMGYRRQMSEFPILERTLRQMSKFTQWWENY